MYISKITEKGNSSYSEISREIAELNAKFLDDNGCKNCKNCKDCKDCIGCTYCKDCKNCIDCIGCLGCKDCLGCLGCTYCLGCKDCIDCKDCLGCADCKDCLGCKGCKDCIGCTGCTGCKDCKNCLGCKDCDSQPLQILGGIYIVTIRKNQTIKIGCKDFPLSVWENESPEGISSRLSKNDLEQWNKSKHVILALAQLKM